MSGHLSDPVDAASLPAVEVDDSGIPKDGVVEHFVRGDEAHGGAENEAGEEEQESVSCMEWKLGDTCRTENSIFWSANGILAVVAGSVVQLIDPAKGRTETVSRAGRAGGPVERRHVAGGYRPLSCQDAGGARPSSVCCGVLVSSRHVGRGEEERM
eukprot:594466-Hanusia_phi.AAC.1